MFSHLHVHTEYSLLDGFARIPALLERAKELGMEAIAITDHGALYGVVEFYVQAKERGIKPIIGCEMYLSRRSIEEKSPEDKNPYHIIVLAKNSKGYKNLIKLSSLSYLQGFYYKPRVDKELLSKYSEGLIVLSGCISGEIPSLILQGREEEALKRALWYKEVFGDFYLELQRHDMEELRIVNKALIDISRRTGIPLVATNDVHYVRREEAPLHDIVLSIQKGARAGEGGIGIDTLYLRSPEEMKELFEDVPQAIRNTMKIAEECDLDLELGKLRIPKIESPYDSFRYLSELAWEGARKIYGKIPRRVEERLSYELDVIRKMNFADYFLIVLDVINFARRKGIYYGVRGSASASLVLYTLGVTDIDPLEHDLVFERFLNEERKELPDIDLDFEDERRDEVLRYVAEKYGEGKVAHIITFGTHGARAAIRDVGRALGIPYPQVDRIARLIPPLTPSLRSVLNEIPELQELYEDEEMRRLMDIAMALEGIPRHASTHAAGIVISDEPLMEIIPLQRPQKGEGLPTTQFNMEDIARVGLVKMDFLGLSNLTILRKTKELLAERGVNIELEKIPLDDKKTYELLSKGETTGVFQFEGPGMKRYLRELKPSSFKEIAAMVALYRPGPKQHIPTYIRAKHGLEPIKFPHPALEEILRDTYGIIVYQEQVLQIVQTFAGYSLGEADIVRKAMGKKIPEIMEKERERFINGAEKKGFDRRIAEEIFSLIEPFAGYAFNKAHATSYAMLAYRTAYLKANYPREFMTAFLSTYKDKQDKIRMAITDCARMGINVLPPDINKSGEDFTLEEGGIRYGLSAIKNVGVSIKPLLKEREKGEFKSLEDFVRRVDLRALTRRTLESLIKAGALEAFGDRASLLMGIDRLISASGREKHLKEKGQLDMWSLLGEEEGFRIELPDVKADPRDIASWERELLGVALSHNPSSSIMKKLSLRADVLTSDISEEMEGQTVLLAGILSSVETRRTSAGKTMVSAVLTDIGGSIDVIAWSNVYERTKDLWEKDTPVLIRGRVKGKEGGFEIICYDIETYKPDEKAPVRLILSFPRTGEDEKDIKRLKELISLLKKYPGRDEVKIDVHRGSEKITLAFPDLKVDFSDELHEKLKELIGEENIIAF